jgi:NADH:ubiquinone oxidoreductase subunit 3 (subunit A)
VKIAKILERKNGKTSVIIMDINSIERYYLIVLVMKNREGKNMGLSELLILVAAIMGAFYFLWKRGFLDRIGN